MPVWAIEPLQECHRSVLFAGTIGPVSRPVAGPEGVVLGPVFRGVTAVDAGAVQAVTVSNATATTVSATARPRTARPPRRGIDMPPIMPDAFRCLARPRRNRLPRAARPSKRHRSWPRGPRQARGQPGPQKSFRFRHPSPEPNSGGKRLTWDGRSEEHTSELQ